MTLRVVNPDAIGDPTKTPILQALTGEQYRPPANPTRWQSSAAVAVAVTGEGEPVQVELLDALGTSSLALSLVGDLPGCRYADVTVDLDRHAARQLRDALTAFLDRGGDH